VPGRCLMAGRPAPFEGRKLTANAQPTMRGRIIYASLLNRSIIYLRTHRAADGPCSGRHTAQHSAAHMAMALYHRCPTVTLAWVTSAQRATKLRMLNFMHVHAHAHVHRRVHVGGWVAPLERG
jgi:hypothetical protein